jgi:hypothetical protein
MREIRQSGSEGGGAETNRLSLPLFPESSHQPARAAHCKYAYATPSSAGCAATKWSHSA